MTDPDYSILIPYKIDDLISMITESKKNSLQDALFYLYNSKLYAYLSDESTKLWHLSTHKLFELLETEKEKNIFEFPDFV